MRAMFGLVGLLVMLGVIMWMMGMYTPAVMKADKTARQQVNQIAGNDPETGGRATDSVGLRTQNSNGHLSGLVVTRVQDNGAYQHYFGLQKNDTIIAVINQAVRMDMKDLDDEEMAKGQVLEAYQRQGSIIVLRDGNQLTLPDAKNGNKDLQNQLDAVQGLTR